MRAVRLHEYDKRPTVDEVADPQITGPNDVIVKIGGAGLCRTDLHLVEGQWAEKTGTPLPFTLGHENAGWVHEVGAAVEIDPKLQPADVAALADAGLTAYHAVRKAVPLLYPGTKAVLIGAGGLGHIGIQALRALTPAEIVVVDRSAGALALAKSIGAHYTVLADGSHVQQVLDLTDGNGAEVVIDFVGERGAEHDGVAMLRRAGSYFVIGYGGAINVPTIDIISTEINFVGNLVGTFNDLDELMTLAALNDAMDDLDAGRLRGRGILVP